MRLAAILLTTYLPSGFGPPPPFAITSTSLPNGVVGSAYTAQLTSTGGSGAAPAWTMAPVPPGLSFDTTTGAITGTPTADATYTVNITATDPVVQQTASTTLSIQINPALTIVPMALPGGTIGSAYSAQIPVNGGSGGPIQWSVGGGTTTAVGPSAGSLPPGLTLDPVSGTISGTPTLAGNYPFQVTAADPAVSQSATQQLSINVTSTSVSPAPLAITTPSPLAGGTAGVSYSQTLAASGGAPAYSFTLAPGTVLPGLTLDPSGVLSGVPNAAGVFNFGVTVTDSAGSSATAQFSLTIIAATSAPPLVITTPSTLPNGTVGSFYPIVTLNAVGGTPPYSFSVSKPPAGLTLTPAGVLSGAPTATGTFTFAVQAADSLGQQVSKNFSVTVATLLSITTASLGAGTVGASYSQTVTASGGTLPYSFSISLGSLPPGVFLSGSGALTGTPSGPGTFSFTVQVIDGTGQPVSKAYSIAIAAALAITGPSGLPGGTAGINYSQNIPASGGSPPYKFTVSGGNLPPGLTLSSSGTLSGTPTVAANYSFDVTVTDSAKTSVSRTIQVDIAAGAALVGASPTSLNFSAAQAGDSPASQSVAVVAGGASPVSFQVVTDSGAGNSTPPAWLVLKVQSGTTPARLVVSANPGALAAASYSGRIRIIDSSNAETDILVTLLIMNSPAALSVAPQIVRFVALDQSSAVQEKIIVVDNAGGGSPIQVSAQVLGGSSWITGVALSSNQIQQDSPVLLHVSVNPQGLAIGRYRDIIRLLSSAGNVEVTVVLLVTKDAAIVDVDRLGLLFRAQQGGSAPGTQSFQILNTGDPLSTVNWTAKVIQGDFVSLSPANGTATASQPGAVTVSLTPDATQATAGAYYALIEISDAASLNAPQYVLAVLDLESADAPALLDLSPAGLLFEAPAGAQPAGQALSVNTSNAQPETFQAGAWTLDGANWLTLSATSGLASASSPGAVTVSVNSAGLAPGIYYGEVDVAAGGVLRSVNVVLIVELGGTTGTAAAMRPHAQCAPAQLALSETGIVNNFSVPAQWPAALRVKLNDDCGNAVTNGSVVATFSNGDAPLSLDGDGQGNYSATWQPGATSSQMQVTLRAAAGALQPAVFQILGSISQNQAPVLARNGTVNNLNPVLGGALAPGTVAQVYGSGLATATVAPNVLPLPTSFKGTSVLVGGFPAPLYYLSDGQLNVQIPSEVTPNQPYSIVVSSSAGITLPDTVDIVPATPGVAAFGDGRLIAQHTDFSLVDTAHPAKPGEYLLIYLAGMGGTTPSVPSGQPSPANEPLARVDMAATVTVNGQDANIVYSGLTPGLAGLYQINFQVPPNAAVGNAQIVITQNGQTANTTTLPVSN